MGPRGAPPWLALLAALACASPASRIADEQEAFDGYPPEVQERIRAGEIAVGFTEEQVRMALGEPDRKSQITGEDGVVDVWIWRRTTPGIGFGLGTGSYGGRVGVGTGVTVGQGSRSEDEMVVEFVNGRVKRFEKATDD